MLLLHVGASLLVHAYLCVFVCMCVHVFPCEHVGIYLLSCVSCMSVDMCVDDET